MGKAIVSFGCAICMLFLLTIACGIGFIPFLVGVVWDIVKSGFAMGEEFPSAAWTALKGTPKDKAGA